MPLSAPKVVTEGSGRGTTVTLSPDPAIIGASAPRSGLIRAQLFETAHLFSGIVVRFQDEIFHAPNGLADFALIHERLTASEKYSWDARPVFYLQTRLEDVTLAAAALGGTNGVCGWHTWVNGSRTVAHGSHQLGFTEALDKAGWNPAIVMLHIIMREPRYAGSTKDCLESPHVGDLITKGVRGALIEYCRANNVGAAV
jgi:DNA gyrase subunit B